jgi:hypothetical protein
MKERTVLGSKNAAHGVRRQGSEGAALVPPFSGNVLLNVYRNIIEVV